MLRVLVPIPNVAVIHNSMQHQSSRHQTVRLTRFGTGPSYLLQNTEDHELLNGCNGRAYRHARVSAANPFCR